MQLPNTSNEKRAVMTLLFFTDGMRTDNLAYQKRLQEVDRRGTLASHVRLIGKYHWDNVWALGRRADFLADTDMTPLLVEPAPPGCGHQAVSGTDIGENDPMNAGKKRLDHNGVEVVELSLDSVQTGREHTENGLRRRLLELRRDGAHSVMYGNASAVAVTQ